MVYINYQPTFDKSVFRERKGQCEEIIFGNTELTLSNNSFKSKLGY